MSSQGLPNPAFPPHITNLNQEERVEENQHNWIMRRVDANLMTRTAKSSIYMVLLEVGSLHMYVRHKQASLPLPPRDSWNVNPRHKAIF